MLEIGIDKRSEVLQYALVIENFTSLFLGALLGIKDLKNSRVLGNKSNPISFNQKVTLLIEIEALDSAEKTKFVTFMEVRNQFMHNIEAHTYETCFSYLDGKEKYLLKSYPQKDGIPKEKQLKMAFIELSEDVVKLVMGLYEKVKEKIGEKVKSDVHKEFMENTTDAIREIEGLFNGVYEKAAKGQTQTVKIDELKEIGTMIRKIFYRLVISKMKKRSKVATATLIAESHPKAKDTAQG